MMNSAHIIWRLADSPADAVEQSDGSLLLVDRINPDVMAVGYFCAALLWVVIGALAFAGLVP